MMSRMQLSAWLVLVLGGFFPTTGTADYRFETIDVPGSRGTIRLRCERRRRDRRGLRPTPTADGHGYVRSAQRGTFTTFDVPNSLGFQVYGINDRGQVVGFFFGSDGKAHGFVRDRDGSFTTFDGPNGEEVEAIRDQQSRPDLGHHRRSRLRARRGRYLHPLRSPGSLYTEAFKINDHGEIAGDFIDGIGFFHGYIRDACGNFTTFDVPDYFSTGAYGINNRGDVVGEADTADFQIHGMVRDRDGEVHRLRRPPHPECPGVRDQRPWSSGGQLLGWNRRAWVRCDSDPVGCKKSPEDRCDITLSRDPFAAGMDIAPCRGIAILGRRCSGIRLALKNDRHNL